MSGRKKKKKGECDVIKRLSLFILNFTTTTTTNSKKWKRSYYSQNTISGSMTPPLFLSIYSHAKKRGGKREKERVCV